MMGHASRTPSASVADSLREYAARSVEQYPGVRRRPDARIRRRSRSRADNIRGQLRATRTIENARSPMTAIGMSHQTS